MIKLQNITKSYQNAAQSIDRKVLDDLNFEITKGDSIAILGPSGCGKSTLLNLIGTLDQADRGQILIDNQDISGLSSEKLAELRNKKIGFVFQSHHLLPQLNLLENILLPTLVLKDKNLKNTAPERAMDLLKMVGLNDKIHQFPSQLSGGECQRTAVIRAIINQPEILLADEPTGSLDAVSAEQIGDLLLKINHEQNLTLLVVTHSQELAAKMKKVYYLKNGKLVDA